MENDKSEVEGQQPWQRVILPDEVVRTLIDETAAEGTEEQKQALVELIVGACAVQARVAWYDAQKVERQGIAAYLRTGAAAARQNYAGWHFNAAVTMRIQADGAERIAEELEASVGPLVRPLPIFWGPNSRDGETHEEWHFDCDGLGNGCALHPDDDNGSHGGGPHVHPCAQHGEAGGAQST